MHLDSSTASEPQIQHTYHILRIPDSPQPDILDQLVTKFKETKLAALRAEPDGFAVKYIDEALHPISIWNQRLSKEGLSNIFVCLALPESPSASACEATATAPEEEDDVLQLLQHPWIATAILRGPLPWSTFYLPESGQPVPEDPDTETRWHLCNVYTSAAHRGKGLARKLCDAAIEYAVEQTRSLSQPHTQADVHPQPEPSTQSVLVNSSAAQGIAQTKTLTSARIRLFCNPAKTQVVGLYTRMGFSPAGNCTLGEAFVANGDGALVPEDTNSTEEKRMRWERRYGLAMERVCRI